MSPSAFARMLAAGALLFALGGGFPAGRTTAETTTAARKFTVGGPFALTDQRGKRVTDADFRGRFMLVFFGYVSCPDACPTGLYNATQALERMGERAKEVVPIFITIDPARDTPEALEKYLSNFHPSFVGLTGNDAEVAQAARAYRVAYGKDEEKAPTDYTMFHSSFFYLMGPDGGFRMRMSHSDPSERMAEIILKILNKKGSDP